MLSLLVALEDGNKRGHVPILGREGLEDAACEDYLAIRGAFERLLPLGVGAGDSDSATSTEHVAELHPKRQPT